MPDEPARTLEPARPDDPARPRAGGLTEPAGGDVVPDEQLLARFLRSRDAGAFCSIVRRHGPMVLGACRRILADAHDAEDAFQAVFLVLASRADAIRPSGSLGGWLHGVAWRTATQARRLRAARRAREVRTVGDLDAGTSYDPSRAELVKLLDEELARLPARYRDALVLCDLEGKGRSAAARELRCPEGTVASRLARGRTLLAGRLSRRGVTLSAAALAAVMASESTAVPPALAGAAARAAERPFPSAAASPSRAATLAQGVTRAMFLSRVKFALTLLVLALAGAALLTAAVVKAVDDGTRAIDAGAAVDAVAWHPDGSTVATQVRTWEPVDERRSEVTGHALQLRDARTGAVRMTVATDEEPREAAFLSEGRLLASTVTLTHEGRRLPGVKLWDVASGAEKRVLRPARALSYATALASSPDGRHVAMAGPVFDARDEVVAGEIAVWDASSGKLLWQAACHRSYVDGLAFDPTGKVLASASRDGTIKLWDAPTGRRTATLNGHGEGGAYSVAFDGTGELLASGGLDGTVRVWHAGSGKPLSVLTDNYAKGLMVAVAFSPDGKRLAAGGQSADEARLTNVVLFEVATGAAVHSYAKPKGRAGVRTLAFSPDGGTLAVGGWQKTLYLLSVPPA